MSVLGTTKNPGDQGELFNFTNGVDIDVYFCKQEIKVQKAWIESLVLISLITKEEAQKLAAVLEEALVLMLNGKFPWQIEDEDIHMNLERFVTTKLGVLGKQIHLGRSRNDLIATTLRLFVCDALKELRNHLSALVEVLCNRAEDTIDIIVPGTTHLQHAQPIRFGHILSAHAWAFMRDKEKSLFAESQAMTAMPLGSAALAGTTLSVNLIELAKRLGFESPPCNSYDAVGDRDFMLLAFDTFSGVALHMSRLSEDVIHWASTPVGLVKLPKNWSTGSSIMPNKRNPDVPELIRGKASHIISSQTNAYLLMKALPTSYDSDLHELKSVFLRAASELRKCFSVLVPFLKELEVNKEQAAKHLSQGHLMATEIANHLTEQGVAFREAYIQTAALVELADSEGVSIEKLKSDKIRKVAPQINIQWIESLSFEKTVEARRQSGGTSLETSLNGIKKLRTKNSS